MRFAVPLLCVLLLVLSWAGPAAQAEPTAFPPGKSEQELQGLKCSVYMPKVDEKHDRGYSLILALHGYSGDPDQMASLFWPFAREGFIVIAPPFVNETDRENQFAKFHAIVKDVAERYDIPVERRHACCAWVSFDDLEELCFTDEPSFRTYCWPMGCLPGGKPPKHCKESLSLLVLVGSRSYYKKESRRATRFYKGKLRSAEVRYERGIEKKVCLGLFPYYRWWLRAQEGRTGPGDSMAFEWQDLKPKADAPLTDGHAGALVYWYSPDDANDEAARRFQTETLHLRESLFFGGQLTAWKADAKANAEAFKAAGLTQTPAVVVYDKKGKQKAMLQGDIEPKKLISALKSVAPGKKMPK